MIRQKTLDGRIVDADLADSERRLRRINLGIECKDCE